MQFTNKGKLSRTCTEYYSDYHKYKDYLMKDFCGRCAYCDIPATKITTMPFEIDHFIPQNIFEGIRDELKTDYNNLVLACKKCNNAKRSKFLGDIHSSCVTNELFYDPIIVDYNDIFFRDELGNICSNDPKGINTIKLLKLYRTIHSIGWIVEQVKNTIDVLQEHIEKESDEMVKCKLVEAQKNLKAYHSDIFSNFIANYNIE